MAIKNSIRFGIVASLLLVLVGCSSVSSTAIYYIPTSTVKYPPKPRNWPIPILGKAPNEPHKVIGRLAFTAPVTYRFMRDSMIYNARENGADAVILKSVDGELEWFLTQVPGYYYSPGPVYRPWLWGGPYGRRAGAYGFGGGFGYGGGFYRPGFYQPGYVALDSQLITTIDAVMIVFDR